jgi:hypothetical protein
MEDNIHNICEINITAGFFNPIKCLLTFLNLFLQDSSQVLAQYAKGLIENSGFCWYWEVGSAPWEEKVSMLLNHIEPRSEIRLVCKHYLARKFAPPFVTSVKVSLNFSVF